MDGIGEKKRRTKSRRKKSSLRVTEVLIWENCGWKQRNRNRKICMYYCQMYYTAFSAWRFIKEILWISTNTIVLCTCRDCWKFLVIWTPISVKIMHEYNPSSRNFNNIVFYKLMNIGLCICGITLNTNEKNAFLPWYFANCIKTTKVHNR